MKAAKKWISLTIAGALLALVSVLAIFMGDRTLHGSQEFTFVEPGGDKLYVTYYSGKLPAGVLLLHGFNSDQVALRSAASEFSQAGVHVLSFDFSGHGRSSGALAFDNATTDRLAREVLAVKEEFKRRSGLQDDQIILLGHSMGARAALQAAVLDTNQTAGLVLLGTSVNLSTNVQAQLFAGPSDANLSWVQALGPTNPPVNILMVSGTWDDILTPTSAKLLLQKLAGADTNVQDGQIYGSLAQGNSRKLVLFANLLHAHETSSPQVLMEIKAWAGKIWGLPDNIPADAPTAAERIWLWLAWPSGVCLALWAGFGWARNVAQPTISAPRITIHHMGRFLWAKLLLWLAALPLIALLVGVAYIIPLGLPVFTLIYFSFISAYGLLMLILYAKGWMPGTQGKLPFRDSFNLRVPDWGVPGAIGVWAAMMILTATYSRSGWFYIFPINDRLMWMILFIPLTTLGFWISLQETRMIATAAPERGWPFMAVTLIGLLPFLLWAGALLAIGSISGVIGSLQGLFFLALVLTAGNLMLRMSCPTWLTALLQSTLLYWVVLSSGALLGR